MDVVGSADPYFVAKLDDKISFVSVSLSLFLSCRSSLTEPYSSTVKQNSVSPVWNERWKVKNVPVTAELVIKIMDKDQGSVTDDYIGTVKTGVTAGEIEFDIEGPPRLFRRSRGTFWFKVRFPSPLFYFIFKIIILLFRLNLHLQWIMILRKTPISLMVPSASPDTTHPQ
jgi:hypothetical protein